MNWKKLGLLYSPNINHAKLISHAANPLAIHLDDDVYRVFFSGRDAQNRSSVGFVDVDILRQSVMYIHDRPVFEHGKDGSFYSHGVSIGNCYEIQGQRYILFMGWQYLKGAHWCGNIGRLLLKSDNLTLHLDGNEPLIAITTDKLDLLNLSYPWVLQTANNYHMWYGSTVDWSINEEIVDTINYAISDDGHVWQRQGVVIPYQLGIAQAFSRPTVIGNSKDGYQMWFSYRSGTGEKYRIGYAKSQDGENWELCLSETGITVSTSGWDSEMVEYPFVFKHKDKYYMLYCGNGYGKTGFGMAILVE